MSFFKKTLASLGIGSATVDAVLQQETLVPGDKVSVVIHVYGGATEQHIDHIDLKLCCRYISEREERQPHSEGPLRRKVPQNYVLDKWQLPYSFNIGSGEERTFDIELDVPFNTPLTIGESEVWLETALDIDLAVDPTDKDMLTVRPDPVMDHIFTELEELGLRIRQVECEAAKGFAMPFVQKFEFVPTSGLFHGTWREVEIIAYRDDKQLQLWFEIDRQKKGLSGLLSNLLGSSELNCYLPLSCELTSEQAANKVVQYLADLFAAKQG
ncbi:sporulation protein [Vibrio rarus]|uniref:sporulation protein n=1 Tax=Vibrio rarus TaxID=413403 RepID=UPI0021C41B6E|nr:sporulation protein [Vibrio rarus]